MSTVRRIAKNFLSLSGGRIGSQFVTFLTIVYLARVLGTVNFGKISFAQATATYFLLISDLGLSTLGIREVARHQDRLTNYVNNILTLRLALTFFSFCLLLLFTVLINKSTEIKYLIIFYGLSLFPCALLMEWFFQGVEKMEFVGISKILNRSLYAVLVFILIKTHKQLLLVPYLWLAGFIVSTGFLLRIFIKQFAIIRPVFNFSFWKKLLYMALPMGFAWMMIQIYNNFDTIMLGFMKTDEVVGWYNAAYKIIFFIFMLGGSYITTIFPVVSRYYKEFPERLSILLSHSAKLMIAIGLPLGVGGTILGKPLMRLLYGTQYDNGIIAFQILIWYVVISFICMVYANSLLACDKERKYAIGVMLAAITNLILNIFLIPPFGLKGAAIATVAAEGSLFVYVYREFQKIRKVEFKKYLLSPLV
ncbi:MAG: flippase, partial [Actinomycetota bacterium]|nr:flippase [Actinomycetota bacterium]